MTDNVNEFDVLTSFLRYSPEEARDILTRVREVRTEDKKQQQDKQKPSEPEIR